MRSWAFLPGAPPQRAVANSAARCPVFADPNDARLRDALPPADSVLSLPLRPLAGASCPDLGARALRGPAPSTSRPTSWCLRGLRPGCPDRHDPAIGVSMPPPVSGWCIPATDVFIEPKPDLPSCSEPARVDCPEGVAAPRITPLAIADEPVACLQPSARFGARCGWPPPRETGPALRRHPSRHRVVSARMGGPRLRRPLPALVCGVSRRPLPAIANDGGLRVACDHVPVSGLS